MKTIVFSVIAILAFPAGMWLGGSDPSSLLERGHLLLGWAIWSVLSVFVVASTVDVLKATAPSERQEIEDKPRRRRRFTEDEE